ncbi:MAG: type III pantothenate kinase [Acholeplasmatales bacterium]|nr:MAG: type III pantothenate kinase [Acholeplasmatales bacterium]
MTRYIDIGNSNIVIGTGNKRITDTFRYKTDMTKSGDEYQALLGHHIQDATEVIIASVVPQLNTAFKSFIARYHGLQPLFVGPGVKTGVKIKTDNPREVGADLVAGAAGAIAQYGDSGIVIDMGTATTVTYYEEKEIKGVAITIGLDTSRDALVSKASKLLQFEFETPKTLLGTNTVDALNAGLLYGHAFQIIGLVKNISRQYSFSGPVIMTGGAAKLIKALLPAHYIFDEHLVLEGLLAIAEKNRPATPSHD